MTCPRWIFRVATWPEAGLGHLSRCRALAIAAGSRITTTFVVDGENQKASSFLASGGFRSVPEDQFEGNTEPARVCIVDGPRTTMSEAERWSKCADWLVIITDTAEHVPPADIYVGPQPSFTGTTLLGRPALLGARFAILGAAYATAGLQRPEAAPSSIVVTFGARDSHDATGLTMRAIAGLAKAREIAVTVLARTSMPHLEKIRGLADQLMMTLLVDNDEPAEILRKCHIAIGAGGVSMLERAAMGLPSITICTHPDQRQAIETMATCGAIWNAGPIEAIEEEDLAKLLNHVVSMPLEDWQSAAEAGRQMVDGLGATRTADALLELTNPQNS